MDFVLVIAAYLALFSLPAVLLCLAGMRVASQGTFEAPPRTWALFLLGAGVALTLPLALLGGRFESPLALVLILLIPALVGLLALLLIHRRAVLERWKEQPRLVSALVLALALLFLLMVLGKPPQLPLVVILPALVLALVWGAARRLAPGVLALVGLLLAGLLALEAVGLAANHLVHTTPWLWTAYRITSIVVLVLAPICAVLLLDTGLTAVQVGNYGGAFFALSLAALLVLGLAAAELRHGILVAATARGAEDHMPIATVSAALVAGVLVSFGLRRQRPRLGMAFLVLVPALLALSFAAGALFEPQEITAGRAQRLDQAVQEYYQAEGHYPAGLADLTPRYLPLLLGPLTGRGQVWCYQSGRDYYRLGYVVFQRYYESTYPTPYYEIRLAGSAGQQPAGPWQCDQELRRMKETGGL